MKSKLVEGKKFRKQYRCIQLGYDQPNYWWNFTTKKWELNPDFSTAIMSNSFRPCHSIRAFRRRLKEWSKYLPSGIEFMLIGRYVNQDITTILKSKNESK